MSIAAVLWPRTFTNTGDIVFPYSFLVSHPRSWWDYSDTAGIFFLTTNNSSQAGGWNKIPYYDDWIEQSTNLLTVLACIQNQKGELNYAGLLDIRMPTLQEISRFGDTQAASDYQSSFREGYLAALTGSHGLWMFAPTNEHDKVKLFGYADGQSAGDIAWSTWLKKH